MIINNSDYRLPLNNFVPLKNEKKQIVIGNTFNSDMKHFVGWVKRFNGNYKKTATFSIDLKGNIFQHFEPQYFSNILGDFDIDKQIISILIENEGYLTQDSDKKNFYNWFDGIYSRKQNIVLKKWRGHMYWAPYTYAQIKSCTDLCLMLCNDFQIEKSVVSYNTKMDNFKTTNGVLYRSNYSLVYTDVSPAWNFENFKNNIENK